jgi:flagellin-like hook-associated protein FlgL
MSGIVLSASVRQNLLSLQSTASLLATTQNDLSTGNKVNSALDNPTNYFTAQSLNNRAGDINNLLDGIGNGVQVLQAANTGLTSLQSLISSAQSIANQALQTTVGYSTKSNVSTTIAGATSTDLRGTTSFTNAIASSNVLYSGNTGGTTAAVAGKLIGGISGSIAFSALSNNSTTVLPISTSTVLANTSGALSNGLAATVALTGLTGKSITVNGHTITFSATALPATGVVAAGSGEVGNVLTDGVGNSTIYLGTGTTTTATVGDVLNAIDLASGVQTAVNTSGVDAPTHVGNTISSVSAAGELTISSAAGGTTSITGAADILNFFGLTNAVGSTNATVTVNSATSAATTANLVQAGSTLNVNGKVITFTSAVPPANTSVAAGSGVYGNVVTDGNGNSTVYLQGATLTDTLNAIDLATGTKTTVNTSGTAAFTTVGTASSVAANGSLQISTGTSADLAITGTGNALAALGLGGNQGTATGFNASRTANAGTLSGKTLTFSAFNGGTAVNVTFGDGTGGTVKTLADLNTALQADNLGATVDANGKLTIAASNDYASSTLGGTAGGVIGGTLTSTLAFSTASAPIADTTAQATRSGLVTQYNNILQQINSTSQDSSFNGVNLLNGDQLKLVFNETGKSTLNIAGVTFNSAGLGLSNLNAGVDFIDNASTNKVLTSLTAASSTLRSEASSLGSNLSIVQIRQDFSKNLINVLQTGSSNLTLADTNEEAANSQALSTRQSIAVSALALANSSQQSVLQLLR